MSHIYSQVARIAATKVLGNEDQFGMTAKQAYGIAAAIAGCYDLEGEEFSQKVVSYVYSAKVNGEYVAKGCVPFKKIVKLGLIKKNYQPTEKFVEMFKEIKTPNRPHVGGINQDARVAGSLTDKKGRNDENEEVLEANRACESTLYTADVRMHKLAQEFALAEDRYVVDGCTSMIEAGNQPSASEFNNDDRGRMYHKSAHGPNGQAGDMQRALMDVHGVSTDYDINKAIEVLEHEMMDMISGSTTVSEQFARVKSLGSKGFLAQCQTVESKDDNGRIKRKLEDSMVKKPWSFIKACFLLNDLVQGKRPYIGMVFGYDAKCSGPQLAALMLGETGIAKACGWDYVEGKDAYELCIENLEKAGFENISRGGIKKVYMGVFYGQGATALTSQDPLEVHPEVIANIQGDLDVARKFHKVVSNSFGKKVAAFRNQIRLPLN